MIMIHRRIHLLDSNSQGQAREYGRITHFLPLPLRGHHFQKATVMVGQISNSGVPNERYGHCLSTDT